MPRLVLRAKSANRSILCALFLALLAFSTAEAQDAETARTASVASTWPRWGAEVSFGGASGVALLRFRSPAHAWVLAADASFAQRSGLPGDESEQSWNVGTRLGLRRYAGDTLRFRPLAGAGVVGRVGRFSGDFRSWQAGLYGEFGATYFFTRHVSLGAVGDLQATYGERDFTSFNGESTIREWTLNASLVRLMAAVYF